MLVANRFSRPVIRQALSRSFSAPAQSSLIINAVGNDRLGIVSDITGFVIENGGNVGDSQAAKLGSHFSLMMLVTVPTEKLDGLKSSLTSMTDTNVAIFETKGSEKSFTPTIAYAATFSLKGADNPGIMHKMTSAFVKHGLSIDKLETDQEIAPYGGALLFKMRGVATAAAPLASGFDADKIKKQLIELGDSLNCDVVVEDIADDSYQGSFYAG